MSASTNMLSDAKAVYALAPTAATVAKSIAAAGPIQDIIGNEEVAVVKVEEASNSLLRILQVTDSGDGIKTTLTAIQHCLLGLSAPSGTVITDIKSAISTGPSAASQALAIAAAGPILDFKGMMNQVLVTLQELFNLYSLIKQGTDSSDPNLTTVNNILTALT